MTIRTRTMQLDDASGELALSLAKLEMEAARGVANKDEQIDFVRDLSRVALKERIRPWRLRATQAGALGVIGLGAAAALPARWPASAKELELALLGLGLLCFLLAGTCLVTYFRRRQDERQWLRQKEEAILAGRNLLNEP
ncbi:hypothetical protein [Geothrix campi]|jgi:hypothetical protein|uniref:hypothetical protein n=1 Tax=Geothrix campi TaxID=2966450 RepID=UPI002148ED14|nr:hypothetical protein [Geothrix sp. SG10]